MAINKKLIYYNRTLANFKSDANGLNGQTTASGGNVGNIPYASIVFTSDGYIWTHGKEFNCNNTWRGILNNLTSTSTTDSLSAYQGKILNEKFANYLPLSGGTLTGALSVPSLTVTGASTFSQAINGSILGNSATASRLLNARTITIGSLSNSFDGSANISYSLASMGAFASSSFTLANIKSTLGISDWALASSKPSYNFSEIGAGTAVIGDGANYLLWRSNDSWRSGVYYHTTGDEAVVFANTYGSRTSWIFATTDPVNRADWTTLTPSMQIKNGKVAINKLIANGTNLTYALEVNGDVQATNFRGNLVGNASTVTNGVYTTDDQTISGNKTFSGSTSLDDATIGNLVVTGGASFALTINGTIDKALKDGSGNTITSTYVKKSGDTMTGLLTTTTGNNHNGIKVGNTYINSINGELILLNNTSIRFGGDSWDYNVWAGLKYVHSSKIVYLGLADGSAFTANSALSGGKLYTPGISNIYIGNGTLTVYHTGNLSIGTLMGSTAIGDSDEPVYWSGSAFVKAGAYPTKASWNYDDKYLPLTGANYNTNTDANPFKISRDGGNSEVLAISVNDSRTLFKYTNDEYSNLIVFELVNTDTENSNGSRASDRNVTISSSNSGISMTIGGNTVWHAGNLTTSAAASDGTTASLVTTGDKYKWNLVYDWLTTTTADTDTTINKWKELEAFLSSITESDTLTGLLALYLPLSGGKMTGPLTWKDSSALPEQTSPLYFLVLDAFSDGGTTKWASKANTKSTLGITTLEGYFSSGVAKKSNGVYTYNGSRQTADNIKALNDGCLHYFIEGDGWRIIHLSWDSGGYDTQIAIPDHVYNNTSLKWRSLGESATHSSYESWINILDSSNYSSYAVAKTGGTMTGALTTPSLTVTGASSFSLAINGSILGNATTASRLLNARNIAISGAVTGNANFDGSGNITINTSVNHTHSYAGSSSAGGAATNVVVNDSNADSTYRMVWHSGNTLYSTDNIYCNPSTDTFYSKAISIVADASANASTDATAYIKAYSNNDWGMIIDKSSSYTYGLYIKAGGSYALKVDGSSRFVSSLKVGADAAPSCALDVTGVINVTNLGNTLSIGSLNTSWCHFQNSVNIPFYFNKSINVDGELVIYGTSYKINNTTSVLNDLRVSGADLYIGSASGSQCHLQYDSTNKVLKFLFD